MNSCDLCAAPLAADHPHLVQVAEGRLHCACSPCALLLGYGGGRYRVVPDRVRPLGDLLLTDAQWEALGVPVDLAFFHRSTRLGRPVAFYPSPAGATECLLGLDAWAEIAAANPAVATMEPDVEALLVNRTRHRRDAYVAPIDACYHLAGLVRVHWRGWSGGQVWDAVDRFFDQLRARAEVAA